MSRESLTRRQFVGALGSIGAIATTGCTGVDPPGAERQPRNIEFTGTSEERFVDLYEAMSPAVVEVHIPGPDDPFEPAGGSGFMMQDVGIVTNAHVVTDNQAVELRYHNREWAEAEVLETDPHSDLAVIEPSGVPTDGNALPFDDHVPPIGTEAMAIGAPFGLGGSASVGIISGTNRVLPSPSGFSIPAAIQTDAAVNPGNSGGPLVDLNGEVVGVVFAGATENVGFAISGPLCNRVLPVLADGERYEHAHLGVMLTEVGPLIAEANDLEEPVGIYINDVVPDSPADGIIQGSEDIITVDGQEVPVGGDVILAVDGTETNHLDAFQSYFALETSPGDTVTLELYRDGEREDVEVTLGTRPDAPDFS